MKQKKKKDWSLQIAQRLAPGIKTKWGGGLGDLFLFLKWPDLGLTQANHLRLYQVKVKKYVLGCRGMFSWIDKGNVD